jgi:3-methyladenine DNA glycosylase AlkD
MKQKSSAAAILEKLRLMADPKKVEGMGRFGIPTHHLLGISVPALRRLAREVGRDHELAGKLWASGIHEAQILAP